MLRIISALGFLGPVWQRATARCRALVRRLARERGSSLGSSPKRRMMSRAWASVNRGALARTNVHRAAAWASGIGGYGRTRPRNGQQALDELRHQESTFMERHALFGLSGVIKCREAFSSLVMVLPGRIDRCVH